MRAVSPEIDSPKVRVNSRPGSRSERLRKARLRGLILESLERRELLSTVPQPTWATSATPIVNTTSSTYQPTTVLNAVDNTGSISDVSVAQDPAHPNILVAVWVRNDSANPFGGALNGTTNTVYVQGAYSTNSGANWTLIRDSSLGNDSIDFSVTTNAPWFADTTDPTVAFDGHDNFYILDEPRRPDYSVGEVVLNQFSLAGGAEKSVGSNTLYQWNTGATVPNYPVFQPIVAADGNQASYLGHQQDPNTAFSANGGTFGAVYVAWATEAVASGDFQQNSNIVLQASADGGNTFSPMDTLSNGGRFGGQEEVAAPSIAISQGNWAGTVTGGQVTVVWDDYNTDATASPAFDRIMDAAVTFDGTNLTTTQNEEQITTSYVRGASNSQTAALTAPNSGSTLVSPIGYGPSPVIASDNTLGPDSPYQGQLYVALVNNPLDANGNPDPVVDNTSIFVVTKAAGGAWSGQVRVNDDDAQTDGFSEAQPGGDSGRPHFLPAIAVDPVTGELAVSYYDARNDPSRSLVATYVNVSNDGGGSFSAGEYANGSLMTTDAITGSAVNLGPVPDNQSPGNTLNRDTTFGYGGHQGLVFYDGTIMPVWPDNKNGGNTTPGTGWSVVAGKLLTAAGPRVISSTYGVVGQPGDTINTTRAADGTPIANAFQITFDQPVDATSMVDAVAAGLIVITYESPDGTITTNYNATSVTPTTGFASTYTINFTPTPNATFGYVGTYSYKITPDGQNANTPHTDIAYVAANGSIQTAEYMNQSSNPATAGSATDTYVVTASKGSNILPLIVPGPHVQSMSVAVSTTSSAVVNGIATLSNPVGASTLLTVVFDRNMDPSTIVTSPTNPIGNVVVQIVGPGGPIPLTGVTATEGANAKTYIITIPNQTASGTSWLNGTYSVTLASTIRDSDQGKDDGKGNELDTNLNAGIYELQGYDPTGATVAATFNGAGGATVPGSPTQITSPLIVPAADNYDIEGLAVSLNLTLANGVAPNNMTAILVGPDGSQVVLFQNIGGTDGTGFNVTLDDTLTSVSPITSVTGTAGQQITGSFNPQDSLGAIFATGAYKADGTWNLLLYSSSTTNPSATLNSWSITFQKTQLGTGLGESIADQANVSYRVLNTSPTILASTQQWTSIGPSPIVTVHPNTGVTAFKTGLIGAIAVDPSDPSGNTVYAGGATGGVWKTTDFLTTATTGPTWYPLTDFGPTSQVNVGAITVVPQKNAQGIFDPTKSIVIVGLGNGDTQTSGTGFLISSNGGNTFQQITGTAPGNTLFSSNASYVWDIAVDPKPNPANGKLIIYAALGGTVNATAGLWKSTDGGNTWSMILAAASSNGVTSVTLDQLSGKGNPGGNLQTVYAGVPGQGVFASANAGASFLPLNGGVGLPLIQNTGTTPIPVANNPDPVGTSNGRILLVKPALSSSSTAANPSLEDQIYEGWLYALVSTGNGIDGLYVTKDYGQNWTKILLPMSANGFGDFPSNDPTKASYDPTTGNGSYDLSLAIDPLNPNIVYVGGGSAPNSQSPGFVQVDITKLIDAHSLVPRLETNSDGGALTYNTTGGVVVAGTNLVSQIQNPLTLQYNNASYLNLIRDPNNVFNVNATIHTQYVNQIVNPGSGGVVFTYLSGDSQVENHEPALNYSGGFHELVSYIDPTTQQPRLIFGTDQGIFTGVDVNGTFEGGVTVAGNANTQTGPIASRNGNLALTQYYYGAIQPGGGTVYGGAHTEGAPVSTNVPATSNLQGTSSYTTTPFAGEGNSYDVQTDPTGSGTVYRFVPYGQANTNIFEVQPGGSGSFISRTFGLFTGPNDTEWQGGVLNGGLTTFGNFAVNSVNGNQIVITSNNGTIYRTEDQGKTWFKIGTTVDGTYAPAVAFGAPTGVGNTDNFIYAGTLGGAIQYTTNGGGTWTNISAGLDGSTVQQIIPDPNFGSTDAIAITTGGLTTTPFAGPVPPSSSLGNIFTEAGVSETISIPPPNEVQLTGLQLNLNITFPPDPQDNNTPVGSDSDLVATLTSPNGTVFTLFNGVGASSNAGFINTSFTDNAPNQAINALNAQGQPLYTAPFTGTYKIQNGVVMVQLGGTKGSLFDQNITGDWTLSINSIGGAPVVASLNSWSLALEAQGGVYYNPNVTSPYNATTNPTGGFWHNITSTFFATANATSQQLTALTSAQADWRYMVPFDPSEPTSLANPLLPILYVAGTTGVYRTTNFGQSYVLFPSNNSQIGPTDAAQDVLPSATGGVNLGTAASPVYASSLGGFLPDVQISNLDFASGAVNPTNGRATWQTGDSDLLLASTFGRGQFTINLAPTVIPNLVENQPGYTSVTNTTLASNSGSQVVDITTTPNITLQGLSAQSNFGNTINVQLFNVTSGTPVLIPGATATTDPNTGKFTITFAGSVFGAIPSTGEIVTIGMQATDQTGATGNMSLYSFTIENPITPPPTNLVLDASTDSGTYNNDQYTNFNNATAANSPLFDVSNVIVPPNPTAMTTVVLLRAAEVNGVIGPFSAVNSQTYTAAAISNIANGFGSVQIADTNAGAGAIPDTPLNTLIDTAPPQPNQYVYEAYQVDYLNVQSGNSANDNVIIDTTDPAAPTSVTLDPSTDSGTSNGDSYTNFNNSNNNPPIFDVSGIEPHATVELIRTDINGNQTIVNIVQNVTPTGPNNTVQIADINGNNTTIPDSPVGAPPDTAPPSGSPYTYTAIQIDLAGNPSGASKPSFGNKGAIVLDGTDADNHGSIAGGVNQNGWLYMQKVVEAIAPNITNGNKVLVALGADPSIDAGKVLTSSSAVYGIYNAFEQSGLAAQGWTLEFVAGTANVTNFLDGTAATAVDVNDNSLGTITIAKTGFLYIPTLGHVNDALTNAELQVIDDSGLDILSYVNGGGGLYTQTESGTAGFGGGGSTQPTDYGWLSSLFPTIQVVTVANATPTNIQLTAAGQQIFPGLTSADLSGGPWHNYFAGTIPSSLAAMFTDTNPADLKNPSDTVILGLSSVGTISTAPTTGDQVIIDSTPPIQSTITLDSSTDSGAVNNDQYTNFNNSNSNPPLFDVTNVEPNGIVALYRTPLNPTTLLPTGPAVLVNTVTQTSGGVTGTMQVPDINGGNGTIPNGYYLYTTQQTDLAGNVGPLSAGQVVVVTGAAPGAPTAIVLDSTTDSGTYDNDQYTNFNNSAVAPAASNAPILDVYGITTPPSTLPGEFTTVVLLRASEVNGVVGAFSIVNTQTYTAAEITNGEIQIADLNGGNGAIPDTPVNTLIDTAPNQPNQYVYQAYQTDFIGNTSAPYTAPNGVIVDTTDPAAPTSVVLDPSTDSGTSNGDSYTNFNNSKNNPPIFDVSGIEPHATVELIRTDINGNQTIVNIVQNMMPTGPNNTVQIADINGNNSTIPDSPVGSPPDTAPPSGSPYTYTAIQIDLAGNPSGESKPSFGNKGAIVLDGTDADNHGSFANGANQNGWLYMQKVLNAIQPNITNGNKVLVALGVDPSVTGGGGGGGGGSGNATQAILDAFNQSNLPGLGWSLVYVNGAANMTNYFAGTPANAVTSTNTSAGTVTLGQTGFLYITTFGHATGDMTAAELQVVDNSGLDILSYVNAGGGLYTQTETEASTFGGGGTTPPPSYGWLSSLFPTIDVVSVNSETPVNIQLTAAGQATFPGLTNADLSGGPWHNYFGGTLPPSLAVMFTDTNPTDKTNPTDTVDLGLSSVGTISTAPTTGDQVIIDSTPPAQSAVSLDPSADSGTFNNDQITNFNNGNSNPPLFDVTNVEPNAILKLYRVSGTYANGVFTPTGAPGLVDTATEPSNATIQGGTITDTNGGNGTIPDDYYLYYITQTDLAGNVSVQSQGSPNFSTVDGTGVVVQIDGTAPVAPRPFQLDPASDTGTFNNDDYTKDNNGNPYPAPVFDLYGIEQNATVELFRATVVNGIPTGSVLVNTLTDVTPTGANNLVQIPDIDGGNGVIADGVYAYTAKQVDLAGNIGPSSNTVTVTINTAVPKPSPLPAPDLEAGSDTGISNTDNITQDDNGLFPAPIFDIGTVVQPVDQTATVQLWRAPVTKGVVGTPILVNTLTNVAGGLVPIADTNAGGGQIADGTYDYYARLISLSGVPSNGITVGGVSGLSTALTVVIDATTPALATSLRLDPASDTGTSNSDGITRITINQHPIFDVTGILTGATVNLYRAPVTNGVIGTAVLVNTVNNVVPTGATKLVTVTDPTVIPDGQYVYTVQQIDNAGNIGPIGLPTIAPTYPNDIIYDTTQPAIPAKPVLDPASDTGTKGDNSTSNTSPFIDVSVSVPGFEQNAQLSLVRDGVVVATTPYNVTTGSVAIQDPGPVPFGTHVYQAYLTDLAGNVSPLSQSVTITFANDAPGSLTLDPGSDSGVKGDDITNVTKPTFDVVSVAANSTLRLLRNGLVVATVPTGAGGTVSITDPGPLTSGVYTYTSQVVDSQGNASPAGPALTITIDLTLPGAPSGFVLDPNSDSGLKGDNLTNINDPTFDASGVVPGATVNLYRNGSVVASLVSAAGGKVTITDPGPVPDGTYTYLVQQVTVAGNVSPNSVQAIITIQTTAPATPTLVLDPGSDSGNKGDDITNVTSPYFDASNVVPGSTLNLYRNGLNVKTLTNVALNASGLVLIQDPGPLTNGSYTYTAQQTTLAGNTSVIGSPLTITINTAPPVTPTTPVLTLDASTDTGILGDDITSSRQPKIDGTTDPAIVVTLLDGNGNTLGTTTSDALGNFSFSIAQSLTDGAYNYQAYATNTSGVKSPTSALLTIHVITVAGDYNGAGEADVAVFRRTSLYLAQWYAANTVGMATGLAFGAGSLDIPVVGDFTGSGQDDPAVYRPSTATWYIASPPTYTTLTPVNFGWINHDVPVPADYNGAGLTQIAVYRPSTGQWFVNGVANPYAPLVSPALSTDIPVPANYDNTGKDEFAVYRPTTGTWYINGPSGVYTVNFDPGGAGGIPVPGAYDASATSQTAELSIFNPTTGQWFIKTATGTRTLQFDPGDVPVPGDYEGTGITEPVVYRPSTAQWFVESLTDTTPRLLASFGWAGKDIPAVSPYRYRALAGGVNAGTNGTITAASIPSLDLGVSAATLSSSIAPATSSTFNKAATPTVATTAVNTVRVRPAQAPELVVEFGQGTGHLVDHALASLVKASARRKGRK